MTFWEALEGVFTRKAAGGKHLPTCDRGLWLDETRGAYCTERCAVLRQALDAREIVEQRPLMEAS